jgi:hypothetical protein
MRFTVKPLCVDTCHRRPRASFAENYVLECDHFSIQDCGNFCPVPFAVKNLLKVDSHLISRHFWHCLKVRNKNPEYKDLEKLGREKIESFHVEGQDFSSGFFFF